MKSGKKEPVCLLFIEKDANSNITPTYYEYSPTDEPPTQEAIDKYGILPK